MEKGMNPSSQTHKSVAPGVLRLHLVIANAYLLETADGQQVLIDSGPRVTAARLQSMLPTPPIAVVLTHGHFDHGGGVARLARTWRVPVYVHSLELPYLTGQRPYPPQDFSTGGPVALISRIFPNKGFNLLPFVRPLPEDGTIPHLPDWHWLHTPGHSPGHVALFRESDRTLISGDAVLTTNVASWAAFFSGRQEITGPPAPSTADWASAVRSIRRLAELNPAIIAAGHGRPMSGPNVAAELHHFADGMNRRGNGVEAKK
jgi:glyoxylase-like metal-dependent hydrolase (beta-lactamase superfamily II)